MIFIAESKVNGLGDYFAAQCVLITWKNQNDKTHKKRIDKNCHIPDLVQAFSNVKNGRLNLVLKR